MARHKYNGVRDSVLGIKIKTGLQPRPAADASDAEWGYYELEVSIKDNQSIGTVADYSKRKRHEARLAREEKEEKEWERKRLANEKASAAKTDDKEKRKRRRPWYA
ncbi:hypothetical protein MMC26_003871 [Xylographa opegraphella]|nr:hypothetical protein [Xylographa opegraphella]